MYAFFIIVFIAAVLLILLLSSLYPLVGRYVGRIIGDAIEQTKKD